MQVQCKNINPIRDSLAARNLSRKGLASVRGIKKLQFKPPQLKRRPAPKKRKSTKKIKSRVSIHRHFGFLYAKKDGHRLFHAGPITALLLRNRGTNDEQGKDTWRLWSGTYLRIDPSMAVMCSSVKYPLLNSMREDMRSLLGSYSLHARYSVVIATS